MAVPLAAIAGAAAGPVMDSIIGPVMANEQWQRSKHVANRQMASAQFLAENQPSWAVEGLRKAGLNPILAATRGFPGAEFAPRSPAPSTPTSDLGRISSSAAQLAKLSPEMRMLSETTRRIGNEADAAFYDVGFSQSRAEGEYQRTLQDEKRVQQVDKMIQLLEEQIRATAAGTRRTTADAQLIEAEIPSAKAAEGMYKEFPELRMLRELIKSVR